MRLETQTVRVGELLGPVDWTYDFRKHFDSCVCSNEARDEFCSRAIATLRLLADNPGKYEATTDGGIPRCGWGKVLDVGMYDGWPYWRPTPSVRIDGWAGSSWHSFCGITDIRESRP